MKITPYEAYSRFMSWATDIRSLVSKPCEDYRELLEAFMANPERHREQFQQIVEAYAAVRMFQAMGMNIFYKWPLKYIMPNYSYSRQFLERFNELKDDLLRDIQPGEFIFDILPSRRVGAPAEWAADWDVHLIEVRLSLHPNTNLIADRVALKLTLDDPESRFIDCFPTTEFTEVGEIEIGLTNEAKFVKSAAAGVAFSAGAGAPQANIGVHVRAGAAGEQKDVQVVKQSYKFPAKILKLVSSAVGSTARWEILRTGDDPPTGGLTFLATLMVPKGTTFTSVRGSYQVELANWGPLEMPIDRKLSLVKAKEPTKVAS